MRKLIMLTLCCALFFSHSLWAQKTDVKDALLKKNVVKINLVSLVFKNASLQYERVVAPKMSFALGVSIMPKSGLPFAQSLKENFADNDDAQRAIESTKLSNFSITPEYRFYVGKKGAPIGFYVAPYLRYSKMTFEQLYEFTASNNKVYKPLISGDINNIGGGVMLGSQWALGSNITLDWWIAGGHIGSSSGTLLGKADMSDMSEADKKQLENDIEAVDIPLYDFDATVRSNEVEVKLKGGSAGIRAFGIALGFRF